MEKTDQQLVADYLNGEESAFPALLSRYLKPVYNFAYRMTASKADAQDIAQETFFKAWRNLKKYRREKNFKTWLFAIARNTAIDYLRKRKDFTFSDLSARSGSGFGGEGEEGDNNFEDTLADLGPLPDEIIARAEDQKNMEELISKLSPAYREMLLLRYDSQFTFDEIGKILGKPLDTVKSQHRRALIELRKIIESQPPHRLP